MDQMTESPLNGGTQVKTEKVLGWPSSIPCLHRNRVGVYAIFLTIPRSLTTNYFNDEKYFYKIIIINMLSLWFWIAVFTRLAESASGGS